MSDDLSVFTALERYRKALVEIQLRLEQLEEQQPDVIDEPLARQHDLCLSEILGLVYDTLEIPVEKQE